MRLISIKTTDQGLIHETIPKIVRIRCTIENYPDAYMSTVFEPYFDADDDSNWNKYNKFPAYYSDFELIISRNPPPRIVTDPPVFKSELTTLFTFHYSTETFEYTLPEAIDYEANVIGFKVTSLPTWLLWKESETLLYMGPAGID